MEAPPPSLQDRKQEFVRAAIWDAAIDLFTVKGFDHTTVEEISEAAGVSRRTFFRYFTSKNDLMGQGITRYGTLICSAIEAGPAQADPLELLRHTVLRVGREATAHPRTRKVAEIATRSAAAREAQITRMAEAEDRVAASYAARVKGKAKEQASPRLLASLTLTILDASFRLWFERRDKTIDSAAEEVFASLVRLFSMPPGSEVPAGREQVKARRGTPSLARKKTARRR